MDKNFIQHKYENELPEVKDWSSINYSDVLELLKENN